MIKKTIRVATEASRLCDLGLARASFASSLVQDGRLSRCYLGDMGIGELAMELRACRLGMSASFTEI